MVRTSVTDLPRAGAAWVATPGPAWICAELEGEALVLGRWQRRGDHSTALRRQTGGRALQIPGRCLWVGLVLPHWGALGAPDLARVLNRHVRPIRAALTRVLRRNVAYFGRDHLDAAGSAVAWIGQDTRPDGATLVETLIGVSPAEAPPHPDPRFAVRSEAVTVELETFARALAEAAGLAVGETETAPVAAALAEASEAGFFPSGAVPVPIGFAEALVRHDGAHVIAARLRGDAQGALDVLGDALAGAPLEAGALHATLARAQVEPNSFLFGVRDASVYAELVATTRDTALAGLAEKYRTLATLRGRREDFLAAGGERFADEELASRGAAFRQVAARFPGAIRQLEAFPAETLAARAAEVEAALAAKRPVATPWIRAVLDFHGTLAAALAGRPPRPRPHILDVVFDELAARHEASRAELEAMVFGAARG